MVEVINEQLVIEVVNLMKVQLLFILYSVLVRDDLTKLAEVQHRKGELLDILEFSKRTY